MLKLLRTIILLAGFYSAVSYAGQLTPQTQLHQPVFLQKSTGFFRFSFDNVSMPQNDQSMGLLGLNYFVDMTPHVYGGMGMYGAVTGTQGGMFILGLGGGYHRELLPRWWVDANMFAGGGGGKSSLVGGGFMIRPSLGVQYAFSWARVGVHYSYISFTDGKIHSSQIGLDVDLPTELYYLIPQHGGTLINFDDFKLQDGTFLGLNRNDFAILLQQYRQRAGTKNTDNEVQDGNIGLVGAEFDHYFTDNTFWWLKASGAFSGIPHGYMDIVGGLGYHWALGSSGIALVPQLGVGAGGGGMVDTGGGFLVNPLIGVEWPFTYHFSGRISTGYLWSPKGNFQAVPITGEIIYHLDMASLTKQSTNLLISDFSLRQWRLQALNQTYFHPQRSSSNLTSAINLIALQLDQMVTPYIFISYQGAFAYSGNHAGGYATGMIGPGLQSNAFFHDRAQVFGEVMVGAGGGGGLALGGGSLIEPLIGARYAFTPVIGIQASMSQIIALRNNLNTPALNVGVTISLDTLNKHSG